MPQQTPKLPLEELGVAPPDFDLPQDEPMQTEFSHGKPHANNNCASRIHGTNLNKHRQIPTQHGTTRKWRPTRPITTMMRNGRAEVQE